MELYSPAVGMGETMRRSCTPKLFMTRAHGLTLVQFSAQLERFDWDRGCA